MEKPADPTPDVQALNTGWRIAGPEPPGGSPAKRLLYAVRRLAASLLRPQESSNATVVRRLNSLTDETRSITDAATRVANEAAAAADASVAAAAAAQAGAASSEGALE